jgi:hypothetical protein
LRYFILFSRGNHAARPASRISAYPALKESGLQGMPRFIEMDHVNLQMKISLDKLGYFSRRS